MIAYVAFYSTLFFQALLNAIFHINWIKKTHRVPLLLSAAYTFGFIWYLTSIFYYVNRVHYLNLFRTEVLDIVSSLCITASLITATYFILMLKPIKSPEDEEGNVHYYFAFPVHLIMYVVILVITAIFNFILGLMTR
jgi:hypothetical protein